MVRSSPPAERGEIDEGSCGKLGPTAGKDAAKILCLVHITVIPIELRDGEQLASHSGGESLYSPAHGFILTRGAVETGGDGAVWEPLVAQLDASSTWSTVQIGGLEFAAAPPGRADGQDRKQGSGASVWRRNDELNELEGGKGVDES
ncbi:hypothetical protein PG991_006302 [Apiospora marii]|uniref:Uncharacterized protein n=1 Tax=Apiospora marii TaxID=335849 RepID=A0ABR1SBL5_9PEZI